GLLSPLQGLFTRTDISLTLSYRRLMGLDVAYQRLKRLGECFKLCSKFLRLHKFPLFKCPVRRPSRRCPATTSALILCSYPRFMKLRNAQRRTCFTHIRMRTPPAPGYAVKAVATAPLRKHTKECLPRPIIVDRLAVTQVVFLEVAAWAT